MLLVRAAELGTDACGTEPTARYAYGRLHVVVFHAGIANRDRADYVADGLRRIASQLLDVCLH